MVRPRKQDLAARIRKHLQEAGYDHNDRLPPERIFAEQLGVSRGALRLALAELEADGLIWRHVGRGTFVGARPVRNLDDVTYLRELASPAQVIAARLAIEPELARLAAVHASKTNIEEITTCAQRCRTARDWRGYEGWDGNFHHAIAKATQNKLLIYLFETLNVVRRSTVWGQLRSTQLPDSDHVSFQQHDDILQAIIARDPSAAATAMRDHIRSVRQRVLPLTTG